MLALAFTHFVAAVAAPTLVNCRGPTRLPPDRPVSGAGLRMGAGPDRSGGRRVGQDRGGQMGAPARTRPGLRDGCVAVGDGARRRRHRRSGAALLRAWYFSDDEPGLAAF